MFLLALVNFLLGTDYLFGGIYCKFPRMRAPSKLYLIEHLIQQFRVCFWFSWFKHLSDHQNLFKLFAIKKLFNIILYIFTQRDMCVQCTARIKILTLKDIKNDWIKSMNGKNRACSTGLAKCVRRFSFVSYSNVCKFADLFPMRLKKA